MNSLSSHRYQMYLTFIIIKFIHRFCNFYLILPKFSDAGWAREAREGRKSSLSGYWEVWHNAAARAHDTRLTFRRSSCARKRALRVRCTGLDCGIRPHADAQQPRYVTTKTSRMFLGYAHILHCAFLKSR